jgi:predicted transglutaminase-like cysteine proteinase
MTTDVDAILAERGSRYGTFIGHAEVTQDLKRCMAGHLAKRSKALTDDQWEALEMIAHKIGRIINGDPDYADSWADIAGYSKLVSDRLEGKVV